MSLSTAQAKEWESIVDAIAAMDGTEELPRTYEPTEFLPQHQHLSPELVQALQAADADFDGRRKVLFQLQTTEQESYQPMPVAPTFTSLKNADSRNPFGRDEDDDSTGEDVEGGRRAHRKAARPEGKDLYSRYRAMTAAAAAPSTTAAANARKGRRAHGPSSSSAMAGSSSEADSGRLLLGRTTRLTSGFLDPSSYAGIHRQPDFMPIILIPSTVTSPLQLVNIHTFLTEGMYIDPPTLFVDAQTGATNVQETKPDSVIVNSGGFYDPESHRVAFRSFRVLDDPAKVDDWSHVCACIVNGKTWEFKDWFPLESDPEATTPAKLFTRLCGFLPYFEEDKIPKAVQEWHVNPLLLTRRATKTQMHIKEVFRFWELLYAFLDQHPRFKVYDIHVED